MGVDEFSGISYYLLDADGHRRFGRLHNTNFVFGFGAVARDGKFSFAYRHPCGFIWKGRDALTEGKSSLSIGCAGLYGDHDVRLAYTFYEDRISIALTPPTRPRYGADNVARKLRCSGHAAEGHRARD